MSEAEEEALITQETTQELTNTSTEQSYLWIMPSPIGSDVALKPETYKSHIVDDHQNDLMRVAVYPQIPSVISTPRFIYYDTSAPDSQRHRYIDLVEVPENSHLYALTVIVDTDRTPNEVVTWTVKRKLNQEDTSGGVIYDARSNSQGPSTV